jgi:hypothetical protein
MEIILGIAILALVAYVFTRKKDVVEANAEEAPYKVEVQPAGTEAAIVTGANVTAVYIAPEAAATTPIPLVVEAPAKKPRAKKPAAAKAPAKPRAPKAPK